MSLQRSVDVRDWKGEASLPVASALDPVAVLVTHPTTRTTLGSKTLALMAFLMALWMTLVADAGAKATDGTYLRGREGGGRHGVYLIPLPGLPWIPCCCPMKSMRPCWEDTHQQGDQVGVDEAMVAVRCSREDSVRGPGRRGAPVCGGQDRCHPFLWSLKDAVFVTSKVGLSSRLPLGPGSLLGWRARRRAPASR